ncbi:MAG: hypothetical protein KAH12_08405 [Anaerolineales bacterium]|nr:hypothetical protein [Anaerolineales bacterium]
MKSTGKTATIVLMVMILVANPALLAWGNPVPGRWEKVAETKPGDWMIIYAKDASQHNYRFLSLGNEFLTCKNETDEEYQYELAMVDKIVLPKSEKYMKKWALWGDAPGAVIGYMMGWSFDYVMWGRFMTAGIGAGVGALGAGISGAVLGAPGETIYLSKEAALADAK